MLVTADVVFWIFRKSFSTNIRNSYDTKFDPPYACIYMDEVETEFLQTQRFKPLVWLWFIDDIFFIWAHGEKNLNNYMKDFNNFKSNLKFIFECDKNSINFLDLHYSSSHPDHIKRSIV